MALTHRLQLACCHYYRHTLIVGANFESDVRSLVLHACAFFILFWNIFWKEILDSKTPMSVKMSSAWCLEFPKPPAHARHMNLLILVYRCLRCVTYGNPTVIDLGTVKLERKFVPVRWLEVGSRCTHS